MDFSGKTAIATGAASGMGLLFSQNFTELGGNVVMCDVNESTPARIKELIDKAIPEGAEAFGMQFEQLKPEYKTEVI